MGPFDPAEALARIPRDVKIVDIGGEHRDAEECTLNGRLAPRQITHFAL
jgi:hypothetical protein